MSPVYSLNDIYTILRFLICFIFISIISALLGTRYWLFILSIQGCLFLELPRLISILHGSVFLHYSTFLGNIIFYTLQRFDYINKEVFIILIGIFGKIRMYNMVWKEVCCKLFYFYFYQVANWGIPLAAIADMKKDPEMISPRMTTG